MSPVVPLVIERELVGICKHSMLQLGLQLRQYITELHADLQIDDVKPYVQMAADEYCDGSLSTSDTRSPTNANMSQFDDSVFNNIRDDIVCTTTNEPTANEHIQSQPMHIRAFGPTTSTPHVEPSFHPVSDNLYTDGAATTTVRCESVACHPNDQQPVLVQSSHSGIDVKKEIGEALIAIDEQQCEPDRLRYYEESAMASTSHATTTTKKTSIVRPRKTKNSRSQSLASTLNQRPKSAARNRPHKRYYVREIEMMLASATVTPDGRYVCPVCKQMKSNRDSFVVHCKALHLNLVYRCTQSQCSYSNVIRCRMVKHMLQQHNLAVDPNTIKRR